MLKRFQMVAGDVALDLVNTLDFRFRESGPVELLEKYGDLLAFLTQSGMLSEAEARRLDRSKGAAAEKGNVLTQVKDLRETLAIVLYARSGAGAGVAGAVRSLERYFQQASVHRTLIHGENRLAWSWKTAMGDPAAPLWLLEQAAADLLLSDRVEQVRSCASDTCQWLFLDTSKNRMRRWCDMKICGNRMKAKRFQARAKGL